jgi:hypothetical protein
VSDAPFRQLFVELGAELFAALKGIGEAAVVKAQAPAPAGRSLVTTTLDIMTGGAVVDVLVKRYGWRQLVTWYRSPRSDEVEFHVRRGCGHRHRIAIDEVELHLDQNPAFALFDALDRRAHERDCYCTPSEVA